MFMPRGQNQFIGKFKMAVGDVISIRVQVMEYMYIPVGMWWWWQPHLYFILSWIIFYYHMLSLDWLYDHSAVWWQGNVRSAVGWQTPAFMSKIMIMVFVIIIIIY